MVLMSISLLLLETYISFSLHSNINFAVSDGKNSVDWIHVFAFFLKTITTPLKYQDNRQEMANENQYQRHIEKDKPREH